jgi:hypothetical protein
MMVTFHGTPIEATLNGVIRATPLLSDSQGYDLDYGFAAVYVSPDLSAEAAVRSVGDRPEIANSLPVMIDQEGSTRYFLPDEFTLQLLVQIQDRFWVMSYGNPPIFVRELSTRERKALEDGLRSSEAFVLRRCQILLASARGEFAPRIAERT